MKVPATRPMMLGPRAVARRQTIKINVTSAGLYALLRRVETQAVAAQQAGHVAAADMLFWRAAALRETAR